MNLLVTEVIRKLKLTLPLSENDIYTIVDYFFTEEAQLANAKESYNETIDENRLNLVCKMADEFNNEPFDLDDLNSRLIDKKGLV